jgi:hypothetical protein
MIGVALPFALSMPADVYARVVGSPAGADLEAIFVSFLDAPILAILVGSWLSAGRANR